MGVPWETVIKMYREELGEKCFDRLEEYFDGLLGFLGSNDDLFGRMAQERYVRQAVRSLLSGVSAEARKEVRKALDPQSGIERASVRRITGDVIRQHHRQWVNLKYAAGQDAAHEAEIRDQYSHAIEESIGDAFEAKNFTRKTVERLREIAAAGLTRDHHPPWTSGVVVAGFGKREHFAALRTAVVEARVAGRLRHQIDAERRCDVSKSGAMVIPFAQSDAVHMFVEGIDPD